MTTTLRDGVHGTSRLWPARVPLLLLTLSCGAFAFTVASASAAISHEFQSSITDTEPFVPFGHPWGLALDSTGNLYVADAEGEAIDIFNPSNIFQPPQLNDASLEADPFTGPYVRSVAVDNLPGPNEGMVYVAESNHENVDVFKPEGGGKYKLVKERHFGNYMYVAFDNSSGPNAGKLYVFENDQVILVTLNPDGTLPESEEKPGVTPLQAPPGGGFSLGHSASEGGLAVGPTGKVYLANPEAKAVDVYSNEDVLELAAITGSETPAGAESFEPVAVGVDPSNEEVYAVDAANHVVDEFSMQGKYLGQITNGGSLHSPLGVAVNASGDVYVSDGATKAVDVFGPDVLVPDVKTGEATEVTGTSATLNATVNPEGVEVSDCHFDYGTSTAYGQVTACEQTVGSATGEVAVTAKVTGLTTGTSYHFRLQATNANGTEFGRDATLATPLPPSIQAESTTNVTASSADLNAKIDPNGHHTTYRFEYGTTTSYGTSVPMPEGDAGSASFPVSVFQPLAGLFANTTYHWRVVATNAGGSAASPDKTFIYPTVPAAGRCPDEQARSERGSTSLPDCRAYELVTPPQKNGALIGGVFSEFPQIAGDGRRVIAQSLQCFAAPESCVVLRDSEQHMGAPYEFTRTTAGWVTHPLAPPASVQTDTLWSVNADVGTALFSMPSPPEGQDDFYARLSGGSFTPIGPLGENAVATRGKANNEEIEKAGVLATADLSHVVYETTLPVWSFDAGEHGSLYEYGRAGDRTPRLVGLRGGLNSHELISKCRTALGTTAAGHQRLYGSLSEDGRIVYFTAQGGEPAAGCPPVSELYARIDGELPDARSALISGPASTGCESEECKENTGKEKETERFRSAEFEGASTDGSRVFFTDTQQLTDGASELSGNATQECNVSSSAPTGCNLYESECPHCDELTETEELARRRLIDVSEGAKERGGPRVQGVMAMSADGSHVYFVAKGVLTGEEENQNHEKAEEEADNLYVYGEGHLAFITTLSSSDEGEFTNTHPSQSFNANVTPDGLFLVFTSHRALTKDDTRSEGPAHDEGPAQVFEYDALTRALMRVSIGELGFDDDGNEGAGDARIAAVSTSAEAGTVPVRSDPTMSDDGAFVFFQSPIALAPGAVNDVLIGKENVGPGYAQNVYEYHDGQVYLISDGKDTSPEPGAFEHSTVELLGSDTSGSNVFFTTFDRLVPEDTDSQRDFYDAHICSVGEPCSPPKPAPPPTCEGESCHGTPPGQGIGQTPGSESFTGPGNLTPLAVTPPKPKTAAQIRAEKLAKALKACRKDKKKSKRTKCVRHARKEFSPSKKKK